jgi:dihydropteroate synthase
MQYRDAAEFLFDLRRFGTSPGLESTRALLAELGDPHEAVPAVQVAGSNGKGSTARMTEACLREAGLRVGLYTSPHLSDLRERIRVDGRKVPRSEVAAFVEAVRPFLVERAAAGEPLTFFETMTALAAWRFERADCDVAVLEVGLGGRLDATSVVDPVAAAVTAVSLEHTSILGETVREIAAEKAPVAPADGPLVTAATGPARDELRERAGELLVVGDDAAAAGDDAAAVRARYGGRTGRAESTVSLAGPDWAVESRLPLVGAHQARNAGVAAALARETGAALGRPVEERAVERGLRRAYWPGRCEVVDDEPLTVLDGAHNPAACRATAACLAEFDHDELHVVFAAMHDKDHAGMAAALPAPTTVRTCAPTLDRAATPENLAAVWAGAATDATVHAGDAVADALADALADADSGDCVLVVGSLFAVAEARERWTRVVRPTTPRSRAAAAREARGTGAPAAEVERFAGDAHARTATTRLERRRAERLRALALDAGVTPAVRGGRAAGETVEVALGGPVAAFERLCDALADADDGLAGLAGPVRRAVGLVEPDVGPYPWADGTAVMGVVNVTPDSFHDGGEYLDPADAVARAEGLVAAGADVVDVGGESTRPGAAPVDAATERERVVPVVEALADADALVSVDTRKPAVARAALDAGAGMLNDVTGLADPEMRRLAAEREVPVVVMHSLDAPVDPDHPGEYDDVVADVIDELRERLLLAEAAGVPRERVVVDPGLGFGKSAAESFELLGRLEEFRALGCPVLVGHSRKSMFDLVGRGPDDRLAATVAATALAADRGADLVRVHDAPENVAAVRTAAAAADPAAFGSGDDRAPTDSV